MGNSRIKKRKKNKMRTGEYCISNIDKLVEEGCITPERARDLKKWQAFRIEHPEISGLTEGACRPLMRETDPEVQAKAIEVTERQVSSKPRSTARDIKIRLANLNAGKGLQGGEHFGKAKDKPEENRSDHVDPVEQDIRETDSIQTNDNMVYPDIDDEIDDSCDIPDMPDSIEQTSDTIPEPLAETHDNGEEEDVEEEDREPEENIKPELEITSKVIKENLVNAGHVDEVKLERIPTEEDKIRLTEKYVEQMFIWGADSEEIKRRVWKAVVFASAD
jgi:hypothetical protein